MEDFSPKKQKGLAALLTEKDVRAAAEKTGVSETTLFRWLQEDDFKTEYRRLRRDAVEQAAAQLQRASSEAVETLRKNLNCVLPSVEVNAAKAILEQATKAIGELDLIERMEELENVVNQQIETNGKLNGRKF